LIDLSLSWLEAFPGWSGEVGVPEKENQSYGGVGVSPGTYIMCAIDISVTLNIKNANGLYK